MRSIETIEQEIAAEDARLAELIKRAAALQGRLRATANAIGSSAAAEISARGDAYLASYREAADYRASNWDDPVWEGYAPLGPDALSPLRVGGYCEPRKFDSENQIDFPRCVDLFGNDGPLIIAHGASGANRARGTFQSILLRIALTAPSQVRFTLLDPVGMGSAFPFRGFLGRERVRSAGRTAMDELSEVLEDIRRINERVLGEARRFSALSPEQRAGETFEVVAIADFPKAYAKDPRALEALTTIANAGARAGRHVLIEWDMSQKLPHSFDPNSFTNAITLNLDRDDFAADNPPDVPRQRALIAQASAKSQRRGGGDWDSVVRPDALFAEDSRQLVATPIGERLRFWLGESSEGKPSAHAMIAGQTGSGKSYLLHVIITGLAARYSPDQLEFTLIDGKHGVEFEAYRTLPHATVVSLRTAPALARSVLVDFVDEMEHRYERFQDANCVKLADYREKTGARMPRKVLVVDEYQQLLDGDSEAGAALLGRLLEKGRAAGMHAILGSQTFEQRGLPYSSLTHVHSWAALSLTENYVQGLQIFGSEGKRLIRDLAASGEVVLNDEGGRDGANSRGAVARLRDKVGKDMLGRIVTEIADAAATGRRPVVLSGREGALLSDNALLAGGMAASLAPDELQALARKPARDGGFGVENWNAGDKPIPLWLGRKFDVREHALCVLRRAPGQNLLVMGSQIEVRLRMLACALASIARCLPPDALKLSVLDGLREDMPGGGLLKVGMRALEIAGFAVEYVSENGIADHLAGLAARTESPNPSAPSHLLVISDPDFLYDLHGGADRFSAPISGPSASIRQLLTRGPQNGLHTILSLSGVSSLQLVLSPSREARLFNHNVVQQMNEEESMALFSSLVAARLSERADHPNAGLCVDQIAGPRKAVLFHAYCANRKLNADQGAARLAGEIAQMMQGGAAFYVA
jgi:S-DNA-T family DNA segregation ATPase FtsK/SpoIIIE